MNSTTNIDFKDSVLRKIRLITTDFDGTLTTCDTLLEFIKYAKGTKALYAAFAKYFVLLVLMKMHLYSNDKMKEKLFSHFFKGTDINQFNQTCCNFARDKAFIMRPEAIKMIARADLTSAVIAVVTASVENWVAPFFEGYRVTIIGTKIEVVNGIITGRFASANCYGQEKVNRIKEIYKDRQKYYIIAYGDSRGDKEMLDYANKKYYKPFRR